MISDKVVRPDDESAWRRAEEKWSGWSKSQRTSVIRQTQGILDRHKSGKKVIKKSELEFLVRKIETLRGIRDVKSFERLDKERAMWKDYWNSFTD